MDNLQKMGAISALIDAATFLVGIVLAFTILAPLTTGDLDPDQTVAFLEDNQAVIYIWNTIIYLVFGVFLVVLALALHERLRAGSPAMVQTATVFGLIWAGLVIASGMIVNIGLDKVVVLSGNDAAQAAALWLAIASVQEGLGGGIEIVGGLWVLLVSWAALRPRGLPKALNYLGLVVGVAGLVTVVPLLGDLGAIFGLGSIVWFVWLGIVMLHGSPRPDVP